MRFFYVLTFLFVFSSFGLAQNPILAKDSKESSVIKNFKNNEPQAKADVKADTTVGIELPLDQTVPKDEGFITIAAKCDGEVKWLVLSTLKVKYFIIEKPNSIIISIPPVPGAVINVFAIGCVSGKLTDHVHTIVTVEGKPDDDNVKPDDDIKPQPKPQPLPVGKLHYSIAFNPDAVTADIARVLNSENVRNAIVGKGDVLRIREINSDIWTKTKLDKKISSVGGNFVLIVQNANGNVLLAAQMPSNEKDFLDLVAKFKK